MERRLGARRRISLNVYLIGVGRRLRRCRASDMSANGVFLESPSMHIPIGATVELVFVVQRNSIIRMHRLPAIVARVSKTGAGMILYKSALSHLYQHPSLSL
jgi:hypothetical protein